MPVWNAVTVAVSCAVTAGGAAVASGKIGSAVTVALLTNDSSAVGGRDGCGARERRGRAGARTGTEAGAIGRARRRPDASVTATFVSVMLPVFVAT